MVDDKSLAQPLVSQESEDVLLDYDEVDGIFFEVRDHRPCLSEDGARYLDDEPIEGTLRSKAAQQILFTQLFEFLTENHVDPMSGLFHFRKDRRELVH